MTDASYDTRMSACPACDAAPLAQRVAGQGGVVDIILSLPLDE